MLFRKVAEPVRANQKKIISQSIGHYAGQADWENKDLVCPEYNHDGWVPSRRTCLQALVACFLPEGQTLGFSHSNPESKAAWDYVNELEKKFEQDSPLKELMRNIITEEGGWYE